MSEERKEEIREMVIAALNWMGNHFFYTEITVNSLIEASYAAHLWHGGKLIPQDLSSHEVWKVGFTR